MTDNRDVMIDKWHVSLARLAVAFAVATTGRLACVSINSPGPIAFPGVVSWH